MNRQTPFSARQQRTPLLRYSIALASVVIAAILSFAIQAFVGPAFTSLMLLAIVLSSWYGGLGPGILAIVAASLVTASLFMMPIGVDDLWRLALMDIAGLIINLVLEVHRRTEDALEGSRERYRALMGASDQIVWNVDQHGQANIAAWWEQFTGEPMFSANDWRWLSALHPDDREPTRVAMQQAVDQSGSFTLEFRLRSRTGDYRNFAIRGVPLCYPDGSFREWVGTIRDITEQKQTESRARDAAQRTEQLQQITAALAEALTPAQIAAIITHEGMRAVGAQGAIVVLCNNDAQDCEIIRTQGYSPDVIAHWQRFALDAPIPLTEAIRSKEPIFIRSAQENEQRYPNSDGLRAQFEAWATMPLLVEGEAFGAVDFSFVLPQSFTLDERDFMLTLARQCAAALERARLYVAERESRREAEIAVRMRDAFFSIASHELKTPLTSLIGQTQLLQRRAARDPNMTDRDRRSLQVVVDQAMRINKMINALLDTSRLETGRLTIDRAPMDLGALIQRVVEEVQPTLTDHTIEYAFPDTPVIINGDDLRLEQVIQNLISNAVKYSPTARSIRIQLESQDDIAILKVQDYGIGIPSEEVSRLFRRFYRAGNAEEQKISGMGIGLYVVKEIVTLHEGDIEVMSTESEGSTFSVRIPLYTGTIPPPALENSPDEQISTMPYTIPSPQGATVD